VEERYMSPIHHNATWTWRMDNLIKLPTDNSTKRFVQSNSSKATIKAQSLGQSYIQSHLLKEYAQGRNLTKNRTLY